MRQPTHARATSVNHNDADDDILARLDAMFSQASRGLPRTHGIRLAAPVRMRSIPPNRKPRPRQRTPLLPELAPSTDELRALANPRGNLSPMQCEERANAALHEAAHVVASCACPGASVISLKVCTTRRWNGTGRVRSCQLYEDEECFVRLVGACWEHRQGKAICAGGDEQAAAPLLARFPYVRQQAEAFIVAHDALIRRVTHAVLRLADRKGELGGRKMIKLEAEIRRHVRPYRSAQARADRAKWGRL